MKATFIGMGTALAMLAMAGMSVSFAFADTASTTATSTATTTAVTATSTATTTSVIPVDVPMPSTTTTAPGGSTIASLLATLQSLMARVHQLQQQILGVRTQVNNLVSSNYQMGSSSPEIKKIQQLLASDPSIYPQGLTTGYFGNLTSEAISRFQAKNGLTVNGQLDGPTKALMQAYLNHASSSASIPSGFLSNGQVQSEAEKAFAAHCHEMEYGDGQFCGHAQAVIAHSEQEQHHGGFTGTSTSSEGSNASGDHAPANFGSSSSSSEFQSWWAPFLNKIRGDHGKSSEHSKSSDSQSTSSSSTSSDN